MNVCSPGTNIVMNGKLNTTHCNNSTSKTILDNDWVTIEFEVHGAGKVIHKVNGEKVLEYEQTQYDPKDGNNFGPQEFARTGGKELLIKEGYISLQSESHPIEFRKVEILVLKE